MSASSGGGGSTDWIERLQEIRGNEGLTSVAQKVLLLPIVAFFVQSANALEAILDLFIVPIRTLIDGAAEFFGTLVGLRGTGAADIVSAGAESTAESLGLFGPLSFPVGVALALSATLVLAWFLQRDATSDLVPFTFTDFPLVGTDEEED